ncbi:tRNA glutamyl-Q(34) synthetase GluQRS [Ascidiaceihabitans sp.]|uniref:tRNA glutamyl-Q(34) synthetase GluQRS n=1 Tax=Ascidiaceihabitans sp. TaxID=1872644 RepID=UPI003297ADC3
MTFRTRFAPSPTGPLHLGHAYSALLAHDMAVAQNGEFLLRIEDIDQSRARPEWETQIYEDLEWLGLSWSPNVMRQSDRFAAYDEALDALWAQGLLYPCTCSRRDIANALSAPQEGYPTHGPDGVIYPGTCRLDDHQISGPRPKGAVMRLNMTLATSCAHQDNALSSYRFKDMNKDPQVVVFTSQDVTTNVGDIVLSRKDMGTSYHLSVVLDDVSQGITDVIRGADLFEATQIHVVLQRLLSSPTPTYHHHKLIRDNTGKRLAKRDDARAISKFRREGYTPEDIRKMVGLSGQASGAISSVSVPSTTDV